MSDWIVNAANEVGAKRILIDILHKTISPKEIEITPIIHNLKDLDGIISKVLNHAGFEKDFIKEAHFEIEILQDRWIKCNTIIIAENNRKYCSKEYLEKSLEEFKAVKLNILDK